MASYAEQFLKSATSAASLEDSYFTLLSNALTSCAEAGTRYFTDMMSPTQQHGNKIIQMRKYKQRITISPQSRLQFPGLKMPLV